MLHLLKFTALLRIVRGQNPEGTTDDVTKQVLQVLITFFSCIFCFAGMFLAIESRFATETQLLTAGRGRIFFHDWYALGFHTGLA